MCFNPECVVEQYFMFIQANNPVFMLACFLIGLVSVKDVKNDLMTNPKPFPLVMHVSKHNKLVYESSFLLSGHRSHISGEILFQNQNTWQTAV